MGGKKEEREVRKFDLCINPQHLPPNKEGPSTTTSTPGSHRQIEAKEARHKGGEAAPSHLHDFEMRHNEAMQQGQRACYLGAGGRGVGQGYLLGRMGWCLQGLGNVLTLYFFFRFLKIDF